MQRKTLLNPLSNYGWCFVLARSGVSCNSRRESGGKMEYGIKTLRDAVKMGLAQPGFGKDREDYVLAHVENFIRNALAPGLIHPDDKVADIVGGLFRRICPDDRRFGPRADVVPSFSADENLEPSRD